MASFLDNWARSERGARMAASAPALTSCALTFTLIAFVWWNLQPELIGVTEVGPDNLEIKRLGPGWPIPSYTGHGQWSHIDVPAEELFHGPRWARENGVQRPRSSSWFTRLVPNGVFGILLVSALVANIARSRRELDEPDEDEDAIDANENDAVAPTP
jgi:hypothetical protein